MQDNVSGQKPLTILLVESEQHLIDFLRVGLSFEGFLIENVTCGLEGITRAQQIKPDVVLTEVLLPDINGLEVCRRLRTMLATQNIPILVLAEQNATPSRETMVQAGATSYLEKPFTFDDLLTHIEPLLPAHLATPELRWAAQQDLQGQQISGIDIILEQG